jgi:hypothetical protein
VDALLESEPVIEIIDTEEGPTHRASLIAGLQAPAAAFEERKWSRPWTSKTREQTKPSKPVAPLPLLERTTSNKQLMPPKISMPQVSQRKDLSIEEKKRLQQLLLANNSHRITHGDELGILLFHHPIPEGVWILISTLSSGNYTFAFPCKDDKYDRSVKMDLATALVANQFTIVCY